MCTVLVLLRPGDAWPLLVGANRDERLGRAFDAPGRHWPDAPGIVAGRDVAGGGSWFGVNDDGVVATIVNGLDRLGPLAGKTSRGDIVLRALREHSAARAARTVAELDPHRYRGFTLLVADRTAAFAVTNDERTLRTASLAPGHHMLTPEGCDVAGAPRYVTHFDAFRRARPPAPQEHDWSSWTELLQRADEDDPHSAMTVVTGSDFGTVSSALLALPHAVQTAPVLLFAGGPPTRTAYELLSSPWVHGASVEHG
jgi:uncharacterized protein with NRDE domain